MIKAKNLQDCCGCSACKSICPKNAIIMVPDTLGFLYPQVNTDLCVNCGMCEKVCPINGGFDENTYASKPVAFGARHKDVKEVETSRSGAVFIALSDWILKQGGAVYGAGFTDHFRVSHKRALTKNDRDEFKGSKYVQSDLGDSFRHVRDDLKNGMKVLFSGTACQIAGLKNFIGSSLCENLYLVDIVCHGVPSPYIWRDYLSYVERKSNSEVVEVNFRDKSKLGRNSHQETFVLKNGKKFEAYDYAYLFYQNISLRKSCGVCRYANVKRPSDVTLADFWGWEKTDSSMNIDNRGVSLVLVNSPKGNLILDAVKNELCLYPAMLENVMQPNLQHPSQFHPQRDLFEKDYQKKGFLYVSKKYGSLGMKYRLRYFFHEKVNQLRKVKRFILGK